MHDSISIPACFSSNEKQADPEPVTRSGQSVFISAYQTKLAGGCCLITITWCKNLLLHGLSISVQAAEGDEQPFQCKVELKPWYFWRKQGSKHFTVDGKTVDVVWDLKAAKFNGETEPKSNYFIVIVCEQEVVLLLGDMKKDAYRRTGCRPSLIEPILVSRREHVFGKKRFSTRVRFDHEEQGTLHDVLIEFSDNDMSNNGFGPVLEIIIDGKLEVQVKHLHWKFRGNECMNAWQNKIEVYWDIHDWLFGSGPRNGLFIFKPVSQSSPSSSSTSLVLSNEEVGYASRGDEDEAEGSSRFSFFLYAWKIE